MARKKQEEVQPEENLLTEEEQFEQNESIKPEEEPQPETSVEGPVLTYQFMKEHGYIANPDDLIRVRGIYRDLLLICGEPDEDDDNGEKLPAVLYSKTAQNFGEVRTAAYYTRGIEFREPGESEQRVPVIIPKDILAKLLNY